MVVTGSFTLFDDCNFNFRILEIVFVVLFPVICNLNFVLGVFQSHKQISSVNIWYVLFCLCRWSLVSPTDLKGLDLSFLWVNKLLMKCYLMLRCIVELLKNDKNYKKIHTPRSGGSHLVWDHYNINRRRKYWNSISLQKWKLVFFNAKKKNSGT